MDDELQFSEDVRRDSLRFRMVISLILLLTIVGVWVWAAQHSDHHAELRTGAAAPAWAKQHTAGPVRGVVPAEGFSDVLSRVTPAVVNISSSRTVRLAEASDPDPFFRDPLFRRFFGDRRWNRQPLERREQSLGSGVIVSGDGYILTNNHVVEGADEVRVGLSDRRELEARIIGRDAKVDIAVLKADADDLPSLPFANSSGLEVGDIVLAIGNPFGIGQTVTMGIVSATGRGNLGIEEYEDFIQTDAAINPGNSGGALIDATGALVGINTAVLWQGSPGNVGIGFAVPVNMARQAVEQILDHGRMIRAYLGVSVQAVTPAIASAMGLDALQGALVGNVETGTPAARAGIERGDLILEFDGSAVEDSRDLHLQVAQRQPGSVVELRLLRDGRQRDLTVELEELPSEVAESEPQKDDDEARRGIFLEPLTPGIARQLGLPEDSRGVVVDTVESGSPWAEAGLSRGDVIEEVDRVSVTDSRSFDDALTAAGEKTLLLLVNRAGDRRYMAVEPG